MKIKTSEFKSQTKNASKTLEVCQWSQTEDEVKLSIEVGKKVLASTCNVSLKDNHLSVELKDGRSWQCCLCESVKSHRNYMSKKYLVIVLHKNSPGVWQNYLEQDNPSQCVSSQMKSEHFNGGIDKSENTSAIKINGSTEDTTKAPHTSNNQPNHSDNISLTTSSQCINTDSQSLQPSNCSTNSGKKSSKARKKKKKSSTQTTSQPLLSKPTSSISLDDHAQTTQAITHSSTLSKDSQSKITHNFDEELVKSEHKSEESPTNSNESSVFATPTFTPSSATTLMTSHPSSSPPLFVSSSQSFSFSSPSLPVESPSLNQSVSTFSISTPTTINSNSTLNCLTTTTTTKPLESIATTSTSLNATSTSTISTNATLTSAVPTTLQSLPITTTLTTKPDSEPCIISTQTSSIPATTSSLSSSTTSLSSSTTSLSSPTTSLSSPTALLSSSSSSTVIPLPPPPPKSPISPSPSTSPSTSAFFPSPLLPPFQTRVTSHGDGRSRNIKNKDGNNFGFVGLQNFGNICYVNCVIQVLANLPELRSYFLSDVYKEDVNTENPLGMGGKLAGIFAVLMRDMWNPDKHPWNSYQLWQAMSSKQRRFSSLGQHDAEEFMSALLDVLHEDLNRVRKKVYKEIKDDLSLLDIEKASMIASEAHHSMNDSMFTDLFHGQYYSSLTCITCRKSSVTFDPFSVVHLPISKGRKSIQVHLFNTDPCVKPIKYHLDVPLNCSIDHILITLCNINPDLHPHRLRGMEWEGGRVVQVYNSGECINRTSNKFIVCETDDSSVVVEQKCYSTHTRLSTSCDSCCASPAELKRCTGCYKTSYCNRACQLNDRNRHKSSCKKEDIYIGVPFFMSSNSLFLATSFAQLSVDVCKDVAPSSPKSPQHSPDGAGDGIRDKLNDSLTETEEAPSLQTSFTPSLVPTDGASPSRLTLLWKRLSPSCLITNKPLDIDKEKSKDFRKGTPGVGLTDCLEDFVQPEVLNKEFDWHCPRCKQTRSAVKQLWFKRLPPILTIQLKRFSYQDRRKISDYIPFPVVDLDMTPYLPPNALPPTERQTYDLCGVINHEGSLLGGHYTSFAYSPSDGVNPCFDWRSFDDSKVRSTSYHHLVTRSAYVLVYRRKNFIPSSPIFDLFSSCVNNDTLHNNDDVGANGDERYKDMDNQMDFNGNFIRSPGMNHSSLLKSCVKNLFNTNVETTNNSNKACGDGGADVNDFNTPQEVFYDAKEFFSTNEETLCDESTRASHIDDMLDNCNINNNIEDCDNKIGSVDNPGSNDNDIENEDVLGDTTNDTSKRFYIGEISADDDDDDFMNSLD